MDITHDPITAGLVKQLIEAPVVSPVPIGGVIQMSDSVQGPLVVHGQDTYLKSGSFIVDGEAEYPEAFDAMTPNVTNTTYMSKTPTVVAAILEGGYLYESYASTVKITDLQSGAVKAYLVSGSQTVRSFVASNGNVFALASFGSSGTYSVQQVDFSTGVAYKANTTMPYNAEIVPAVANGVLVLSSAGHNASAISLSTFAVTNSSVIYNQLRSVMVINNIFVALCSGYIYHTLDGITWTGISLPGQSSTEVAYANGLYYRRTSQRIIYTSPDLTTWTAINDWDAHGLFGFDNSIYSWGVDHVLHKLVGNTWVSQKLAGLVSGYAANNVSWIATSTIAFFKGFYVDHRGFIGLDPYPNFKRVANGADIVVIETTGTRCIQPNSVGIPAKTVPDGVSNFLRVK